MSKEDTQIKADKYFDNINWNMLLNECENPLDELKKRANLYAQAKVEELQKENKHLKQVYEHRCNEVKDKVETIHNYLNQITQLQKDIDKAYEALNDIVWLVERGASMEEVIESVNAKARPFLITNKKEG